MKKVEIKINNEVHTLVKGEKGLNCYARVCSLYDICMNQISPTGLCEVFGSVTGCHFELQRK